MFSWGSHVAGAGLVVVRTGPEPEVLDREMERLRLDAIYKCKWPVQGWKLY